MRRLKWFNALTFDRIEQWVGGRVHVVFACECECATTGKKRDKYPQTWPCKLHDGWVQFKN